MLVVALDRTGRTQRVAYYEELDGFGPAFAYDTIALVGGTIAGHQHVMLREPVQPPPELQARVDSALAASDRKPLTVRVAVASTPTDILTHSTRTAHLRMHRGTVALRAAGRCAIPQTPRGDVGVRFGHLSMTLFVRRCRHLAVLYFRETLDFLIAKAFFRQ